MTEQEVKDGAPSGATYYLLVPNGSGQPYYLFKKGGCYYLFHSKDIFPYSHMIKHIKPL